MDARNLSLTAAGAVLRTDPPASKGEPAERSPFTITISREVGAGGLAVASELGRRLGIPVYDREVLDRVAGGLKLRPARLECMDERESTWLEDCLGGWVNEHHLSPEGYLKHLTAVIRDLGKKGDCIIVGRGANFVLPPETTLRVRLIAPHSARLRAFSSREGGANTAEAMDTIDRERELFTRRAYGKDAASPSHYDLVLDTSRLTPDGAVDLILRALRRLVAPAASERAGVVVG